MKIGLDTSVVVRLLVGQPESLAECAWQALREARATAREALVSDLVVSETYFALQYHYGVPKVEALEQLRNFLESGYATSSGCAAEILATAGLAVAKPGFVDRLTHCDYVHQADEMLTFETAASKLARVRVLKG